MNVVQIGDEVLNKSVTSREQLLDAAKVIAYGQGLAAVNIRAVATACGIAVGSIYNYFPTKADLIAAIIEDFWRNSVRMEHCIPAQGEPFPAFVGRLYGNLAQQLKAFQSGFLAQVAALGAEERRKGRILEAVCFDHMKHGLRMALDQSGAASPLLENDEDKTAFIDLVFATLMSLLRQGKDECAYLQRVLEALFSNR